MPNFIKWIVYAGRLAVNAGAVWGLAVRTVSFVRRLMAALKDWELTGVERHSLSMQGEGIRTDFQNILGIARDLPSDD